MNSRLSYSRRDFIKLGTMAAVATSPLMSLAGSFSKSVFNNESKLKIFIFSKHLQFLNYNDMSEAAAEMGFDGIDLTLRPGGHVEPSNVFTDLPKATEAMKSYGLIQQLLTTSVKDANNPLDRNVLEAVSQLGYKFYRTGWFKYSKEDNIKEREQVFKKRLRALAELNRSLGISGSYQNHSGHYFGSSIWEINNALEDLPPLHIGSQYDIMHATVEGGKNWEIGFRLIKDRINSLVVKDFKWGKVNGNWKTIPTPLGEGMVNFDEYFSLLKKLQLNHPLSIHCEFDLGGAERGNKPTIRGNEVLRRIKKELLFVKEAWEKA